MNCVICKHGQMRPGTATVTFDRAGLTVVFRNVPAQVCDSCGEYTLDEAVSRSLLERAEAAAHDGTQVKVVQYAA